MKKTIINCISLIHPQRITQPYGEQTLLHKPFINILLELSENVMRHACMCKPLSLIYVTNSSIEYVKFKLSIIDWFFSFRQFHSVPTFGEKTEKQFVKLWKWLIFFFCVKWKKVSSNIPFHYRSLSREYIHKPWLALRRSVFGYGTLGFSLSNSIFEIIISEYWVC